MLWVTVCLTDKASGTDPALIERSIRSHLKSAEVFVPASVTISGKERVVRYVLDGYAFIKHTFKNDDYFRLVGTTYVQDVVLAMPDGTGTKRVQTIPDNQLSRLRKEVEKLSRPALEVGDVVVILTGIHRNLRGVVINNDCQKITVELDLRAKTILLSTDPASVELVVKSLPIPPGVELVQFWLAAYNSCQFATVLPFLRRRLELLVELKNAIAEQKAMFGVGS